MRTFFWLPLLTLLSAWGFISPPAPVSSSPRSPSAIVRPIQTATAKATTSVAVHTSTSTKTPVKAVAQKMVAAKPIVVAKPSTATQHPTAAPKLAPEPPQPVPTPAPVPAPTVNAQPAPVPNPQPPQTPAPSNSSNFASEIELAVFANSNIERAQKGLSSLTWDAKLASIARMHSADMIAQGYFSHADPNGCGSSCRANNANYGWTAIGENIYMTEGYNLTSAAEAAMVVEGWMNSAGHRANILGSQYTHSGVGVAVEGEKVYITAMYAKPR